MRTQQVPPILFENQDRSDHGDGHHDDHNQRGRDYGHDHGEGARGHGPHPCLWRF